MNKTNIEYLTHTWNPIAMRCSPVSEGCKNCWHISLANRFKNNQNFDKETREAYAGKIPLLVLPRIQQLIKSRKPAIVGVQFMGDLFHENILPSFITTIFQIMIHNPHHIYMVLTKRPKSMVKFLEAHKMLDTHYDHIYLGVSVENDEQYTSRLERLVQIDAFPLWISAEPLLEIIDVRFSSLQKLDFVTVGGETGNNARQAPQLAFENFSYACGYNNIPYFFKHEGTNYFNEPHKKLKRFEKRRQFPSKKIENIFKSWSHKKEIYDAMDS